MDKDRIAFLFASIGGTRTLAASTVSAGLQHALSEGRWLIHVPTQSDAAALLWVQVNPWVSNVAPIVATVGVAANSTATHKMALSRQGISSVEFNVIKGYNDGVGVILSAGTADVHFTKVSRQ